MSSGISGARVVTGHHGGGRITPWEPGKSGNPSGRPSGLKAVREYCRDMSMESAKALGRIISDTVVDEDGRTHNREDGRIVVVAAQTLLTWAYGKPPDYDPREDRPPVTFDTSKLSTELKIALKEILRLGVVKEATDDDQPASDT